MILYENVACASAEVRALLLRILEGGGLRDATGLHVPFGNAVVALTSAEETREACVGGSSPAASALRRRKHSLPGPAPESLWVSLPQRAVQRPALPLRLLRRSLPMS